MTEERRASPPDFTKDVPWVVMQERRERERKVSKITRGRNVAMALVLVGFVALFFAITIVKFGH